MHSSSAAAMPSVSPYGSAERSFRNHSEASEEAAMTRQVLIRLTRKECRSHVKLRSQTQRCMSFLL